MSAVLKKVSRADKLRAMEELWDGLTRNAGKFDSRRFPFAIY